jgi:hypothetical protein
MTFTGFKNKEVTESTPTRFSDSPLGKQTTIKHRDIPIDDYDKPLWAVRENNNTAKFDKETISDGKLLGNQEKDHNGHDNPINESEIFDDNLDIAEFPREGSTLELGHPDTTRLPEDWPGGPGGPGRFPDTGELPDWPGGPGGPGRFPDPREIPDWPGDKAGVPNTRDLPKELPGGPGRIPDPRERPDWPRVPGGPERFPDTRDLPQDLSSGPRKIPDGNPEVVKSNLPDWIPRPDKDLFDKTMAINDMPLAIRYENIKNCPRENGRWEGEEGNSKWIPDPDYVPKTANPDGLTMKEILAKYDIDGIVYKDGQPDFTPICKGEVEIKGFSTERDENFDKADEELAAQKGCTAQEVAAWRHENKYTWHECKDMKTMQKVPSEIHSNCTHRGGISEAKNSAGE